jgi:hypothetical protein
MSVQTKTSTISLPNGVNYDQLKTWLTDSKVEVYVNFLKTFNENLGRKTFVGGTRMGNVQIKDIGDLRKSR